MDALFLPLLSIQTSITWLSQSRETNVCKRTVPVSSCLLTACHEKLRQASQCSSSFFLPLLPLRSGFSSFFFRITDFTKQEITCYVPHSADCCSVLTAACERTLRWEGSQAWSVNLWNDERADRCWLNGQGCLISAASNKLL